MTEIHCYVCSHIFADFRPVLLVARESGDWMFLCGDTHDNDESYHLVGISHLVERDSTLRDLVDLPDNFQAERSSAGEPWVRKPYHES